MEPYEQALLDYALKESRLGEEFFEGRARILRESVLEREHHIHMREEIHHRVLHEIEQERWVRERRLQMLPPSYAAERTTLMRQVDGLNREARGELVRFQKDVAQWSKEARDKLEEYEGMAQLFSALAVTRREREAP